MKAIENRILELERKSPDIDADTVTRIHLVGFHRHGETAPEIRNEVELWRHPDWERIEAIQADLRTKNNEPQY